MKRVPCFHSALALVALGLSLAPAAGAADRIPGPFRCDGLAFYLVHPGGPLTVRVTARRPSPELADNGGIRVPHAVCVRFFDAEERTVRVDYHRFDDPDETERSFACAFPEAAPGIYQVRWSKTQSNPMTVDLTTDPPVAFGLLACRARLEEEVPGQFGDVCLYIPPEVRSILPRTYGAELTLRDAGGRDLPAAADGRVAVAPGTVIRAAARFDYPNGAIGFTGMPAILCPDEASARAIRGSVEEGPGGRRLAHKFQVRMLRHMLGIRPEELQVEPVPTAAFGQGFLDDPRHAGLVGQAGPFSHVPKILATQVIDPDRDDYGQGICASLLGPAHAIDAPFNPYRRNPAILRRILLYEFAGYLDMAENGTFDPDDWNHYSGGDGLGNRKRIFQFGSIAPLAGDEVRALWYEGASKVLHRWGMSRVSCENQTAHWLADLWFLADGSGNDLYRRMARDFAEALESPELNAFMRTGYQQERYGPDATYQGLSACQQALYFRYSGDETVREGLQRIYRLFNHTVAPEPDGGPVLGASNFSHRTSGSWVQRQYNGGCRLMGPILPEAGVWYPEEWDADARARRLAGDLARDANRAFDDAWYAANMRWAADYAYHPWTAFFNVYVFPTEAYRRGTWPVLEEERFTRRAGDEFIFVRRPAYYAAVYTGRTSHDWVRAGRKPNPLPPGWSARDGVLRPTDADSRKNAWHVTQGLSLLWTPGYGNLVTAKNWNAYTAHIVRADHADGTASWPDYWEFDCRQLPDDQGVEMTSRLTDLPVAVRETILFEEEGLRVDTRVSAEAAQGLERLVRQIPFAVKPGLELTFRDAAGETTALPAVCGEAVFRNADGHGVRIRFTEPVRLSRGPDSENNGRRVGVLEADLGGALEAGDDRSCSYRARPF